MSVRYFTLLCAAALLIVVPATHVCASDSVDLWVSGLTITPLGDDWYTITPTVAFSASELTSDYAFDVKVEVGTESDTQELTIDGDSVPIYPASNGCINCSSSPCSNCNNSCPDIGWPSRTCFGEHPDCLCMYPNPLPRDWRVTDPSTLIKVTLDVDDDVPELNEANNTFEQYYTP